MSHLVPPFVDFTQAGLEESAASLRVTAAHSCPTFPGLLVPAQRVPSRSLRVTSRRKPPPLPTRSPRRLRPHGAVLGTPAADRAPRLESPVGLSRDADAPCAGVAQHRTSASSSAGAPQRVDEGDTTSGRTSISSVRTPSRLPFHKSVVDTDKRPAMARQTEQGGWVYFDEQERVSSRERLSPPPQNPVKPGRAGPQPVRSRSEHRSRYSPDPADAPPTGPDGSAALRLPPPAEPPSGPTAYAQRRGAARNPRASRRYSATPPPAHAPRTPASIVSPPHAGHPPSLPFVPPSSPAFGQAENGPGAGTGETWEDRTLTCRTGRTRRLAACAGSRTAGERRTRSGSARGSSGAGTPRRRGPRRSAARSPSRGARPSRRRRPATSPRSAGVAGAARS